MNYHFNSKDVLITPLGEEGVAFNNATNEYFSLNETSFKILRGIENNLAIDDICTLLQNEYAIAPEACKEEVERTLGVFLEKALITEA